MKRFVLVLAVALLTGCSSFQPTEKLTPLPSPTPQQPAPQEPVKQEPAPQQPAPLVIPTPDEICIKPEESSGIHFALYKPQGDSTFRAKPGWVISRPAMQVLGAVGFPREVDPTSVKLSIEPADHYRLVEQPRGSAPDFVVPFTFMPVDGDPNLALQAGKPGWITITMEGAKDTQGVSLQEGPLTLKIFAYDQQMQDTYPYLSTCYSSLEVSPGPGGP